jgi:hypothetical protein
MFAIHGAEHEFLPPPRRSRAGCTTLAQRSVPYVKWGMKNPSTLMLRVSDKVEITIQTAVHTM